MAYVRASLVLETTTTTGTGTLTLAGAKDANWLTFASAVGEGNTCSYGLVASNGQRETGVGTVVGSTLERTTLIASSTGSKLVLPAGTHEVSVTANSTSFSDGLAAAAHAASHATGQSDALTAANIGAEPALGNPGSTGYVLSSTTGGTRSWVAQSGGSGSLDIDGLTDIGAALADGDELPVYDLSATANKKTALSRVWTYIKGLIESASAGIAPYLTGYTQAGLGTSATTSAYYSGTTLTIPLDGRVYDFDFPANNITIAFGSPPSTPICTDTVLILKQRTSSTMYGITSWPSGIKWPGGIAQTMPQTLSARMRVVISVSPSGIYDVSATWMGV